MFEGPPESAYGRVLQETVFFSKVPPGVYNEIVRRMDPKVAIDIPRMCTNGSAPDILQLSDAQRADLNALVTAKPNTTDIRREVYPVDEPRLGVRRTYLRYNFETETQYTPITRGFMGMRIRVRQFDRDGYDIFALYVGEQPSAVDVREAFINFRMYIRRNPFDIVQVPGDHVSYDLLERDLQYGVQGTRYRHVHMIGNFCVTNSAKDVFRPDSAMQ